MTSEQLTARRLVHVRRLVRLEALLETVQSPVKRGVIKDAIASENRALYEIMAGYGKDRRELEEVQRLTNEPNETE